MEATTYKTLLFEKKTEDIKLCDLVPIVEGDTKRFYNRFIDILKYHKVHNKENAFRRLFNLIICKIYDENSTRSDLNFQWSIGDSYEFLLQRLDRMYIRSMCKYFDTYIETITYYGDTLYRLQDFAFLDVYNVETCLKNAVIVREVVELLEGWKLSDSKNKHFLGEFFENLVNTNSKQESGQFFTPIPLSNFIVKCLPIKNFIESKAEEETNDFLPYVIDNSCGSGNLLVSAIEGIQEALFLVKKSKLNSSQISVLNDYKGDDYKWKWVKEHVYGVEQDSRLAKTTSLCLCSYGEGINIINASGLAPFGKDNYKGKLQSKEQFDVFLGNPPYSVKGFMSGLSNHKDFILAKGLTDVNNNIEALFVERMCQLVKPQGYAVIILPSTILNSGRMFEKARIMLLQNFHVKAIMYPGRNAFMCTNAITVILFLKKREIPIQLNFKEDYKEMVKGEDVLVVENKGEGDQQRSFLGYDFTNKKGDVGIKQSEGLLMDEDAYNPEFVSSYVLKTMEGKKLRNEDVADRLKPFIHVMPFKDCFDWKGSNFDSTIRTTIKKKL